MSEQWFALLHTPGPALPADQSVFDHPGFAEHFAFLQQLAADGLLVAAGPLTDSDSDGLTVIRADSVEQARQLAEQQDGCVRVGVLRVTVRPWQVVLAPIADR